MLVRTICFRCAGLEVTIARVVVMISTMFMGRVTFMNARRVDIRRH
jgi:hypothetical protein